MDWKKFVEKVESPGQQRALGRRGAGLIFNKKVMR